MADELKITDEFRTTCMSINFLLYSSYISEPERGPMLRYSTTPEEDKAYLDKHNAYVEYVKKLDEQGLPRPSLLSCPCGANIQPINKDEKN
jgi:hypothetical protein